MQGSTPLLTLPVTAAAALLANRAVTGVGTVPAAGGRCLGFTRTAAAIGERVPVDVDGTTLAEAGAAIAIDQSLELDAQGRIVPLVSGKPIARALSAATAAGQIVEVLVIAN